MAGQVSHTLLVLVFCQDREVLRHRVLLWLLVTPLRCLLAENLTGDLLAEWRPLFSLLLVGLSPMRSDYTYWADLAQHKQIGPLIVSAGLPLHVRRQSVQTGETPLFPTD